MSNLTILLGSCCLFRPCFEIFHKQIREAVRVNSKTLIISIYYNLKNAVYCLLRDGPIPGKIKKYYQTLCEVFSQGRSGSL